MLRRISWTRPLAIGLRPLTLFLFSILAPTALASGVEVRPWQELCLRADMIAVVECTVAGGIVAEYRVVESWKGEASGSMVTIEQPTRWLPLGLSPTAGGDFPISLCGERYLVAAYSRAPRAHRDSRPDENPLTRRQLGATYCLRIDGGHLSLPPGTGPYKFIEMGSMHEDLASMRRAMRGFLALDLDQQELVLLRALFENVRKGDPVPKRFEGAAAAVRNASSEMEFFAALIVLAKQHAGGWPITLIERAGSVRGLQLVEEYVSSSSPEFRASMKNGLDWARSRLGVGEPPWSPRPKTEPLTDRDLSRLQRRLADRAFPDELDEKTREGIRFLLASKPEFILWCLMDPVRGRFPLTKAPDRYRLASWIVVELCRRPDAAKHLRVLIEAPNSTFRVAAAVYLAFYDEPVAFNALRREAKRDDEAGDWAALTLARRGDKSVISRALEIFRRPVESHCGWGVVNRLRVLLSNSARASGVKAPPLDSPTGWDATDSQERFRTYRKWWDEVGGKISVRDPWLPTLAKQKVD